MGAVAAVNESPDALVEFVVGGDVGAAAGALAEVAELDSGDWAVEAGER